MSGKSKAFTKEEELLLQDFSRNVSTKSSALFYGNALIVSSIPICKCIARVITGKFAAFCVVGVGGGILKGFCIICKVDFIHVFRFASRELRLGRSHLFIIFGADGMFIDEIMLFSGYSVFMVVLRLR